MEGSPDPAPKNTTRRPWLLPRLALLFVAVVCVLIGRGLGILGGDESDDASAQPVARPGFVDPKDAPADVVVSPAPVSPLAPASPAPAPLAEAPPQRAASAVEPAARVLPATDAVPLARLAAVQPPSTVAAPDVGLDADRFASLLSVVEARRAEGALGAALAAIDRVRSLPIDAGQTTTVQEVQRRLEDAFATRLAELVGLARSGQVLAARGAAGTLLADAAPALHGLLAVAIGAPTTGALPAVPAADGMPWPTPAALARDRSVRVQMPDATDTGRIVDSRSDQVTVRVQRGQAVTFPTVRVVLCEPVDATPAEAVEMGFAALHAKDGLLARLWLACAKVRGDGQLGERGQRLASLLR